MDMSEASAVGTYVCTSTNSVGESDQSNKLVLEMPPNASQSSTLDYFVHNNHIIMTTQYIDN